MKESVIGFDAREMSFSDSADWPSERRKIFLLKSDVEKPLSVDTSVWNSIFDIYEVLKRPRKMGWRNDTWARLPELQEHLRSCAEVKIGYYWTIAITQFLDDVTRTEIGVDVLPVMPNTINPDWQLLGYDVAELTLLSSLMNMGYRIDEKRIVEEKFAESLNKYHLFTDEKVAQEFTHWSNARDKGHGPFYIYGLYRVESNT